MHYDQNQDLDEHIKKLTLQRKEKKRKTFFYSRYQHDETKT